MSTKTYGGQAVLEGVMMRGQRHMAVACRAPTGDIVVHSEAVSPSAYAGRVSKIPLVRGAVMIWDTMALGIRALMFAANVAGAETKEEARDATMPTTVMWTTIVIAMLGAVGLFFVLPVLAMGYLDQFIGNSMTSNLVEKAIRLVIMVGYMFLIGQMPDIKRVFMYHGAEHKTINAYEAGAPLTPESVQRFTIMHPRCGTTFLLIVMIISFFVFSLLGQPPMLIRIASRIVLIPVIAGIAYEVIKWTGARYHKSAAIRTIMAPGLAVQKLTTREPDLDQIAVAIAALQPVLDAEEPKPAAEADAPEPRVAVAAAAG